MFIAVILGYALASVFALCGIFNCAAYCMGGAQGGDASSFLNGFTTAAMPLLYAVILLILIQIATQLERMGIQTEISLLKGAAPKTTTREKAPKAHGTAYVPKAETHTRRSHDQRYFVTHAEQGSVPAAAPAATGTQQTQQAMSPAPEHPHSHPTPRDNEQQFFRTN
ncbi:MAG: hypothetical protein IJE66_04045 [Akkermansia sp.]|nr:hypothetical protein [Akkermansia sp.]